MLASFIHIACNMTVNKVSEIIKISNSLLGQLLLLRCSYSLPIIVAFSQLTCKIYR